MLLAESAYCFANESRLACRSSRSHALFSVTVNRVIVELLDELDSNFKAKVSDPEEVACSCLSWV